MARCTSRATAAGHGRTTLLVKPAQVETVILAGDMGKLQLSLRRPNDTAEETTGGVKVSDILGNKSERTDERRTKESPSGGESLVRWLEEMARPTLPIQEKVEPVQVILPETWTIVISTPTGQETYEWSDPNQLPKLATPATNEINPPKAQTPSGRSRWLGTAS